MDVEAEAFRLMWDALHPSWITATPEVDLGVVMACPDLAKHQREAGRQRAAGAPSLLSQAQLFN